MMAVRKEFRLPDVGEGLTEAEVVSWKVKPGDAVRINDVVVEIETAKSLVELPVPYAGVVAELLVPEGRTVAVGTPIIAVETAGAAPSQSGLIPDPSDSGISPPVNPDAVGQTPQAAAAPGLIGGPAPGGRTSVLVGYGPRETATVRRPRKANVDSFAEGSLKPQRHGGFEVARMVEQQQTERVAGPSVAPHRTPHLPPSQPVPNGPRPGRVLAKPPVRKLAKDLGIDLAAVIASGPGGIVTREDLHVVANTPPPGSQAPSTHAPSPHASSTHVQSARAPELTAGTETSRDSAAVAAARETRIPVKGVRRVTAQAMVSSAFTAPHVTEFLTTDVTRTMKLVGRWRRDPEFEGVKVSPLLVVAKALLIGVRRNPGINASWDEAAQEIVVKHYVNLGIAAATPRGLMVPNIKDAHARSVRELADELAALTATARQGRTSPADMMGGTISITNVGVFGVDTGTPILNPGEAAILAFGAVRPRPWVHRGKVRSRQVTTLALSFDHRLVDGSLGSRFLADVAAVLERPDQALVWS
ncbi:MAG: dihydrolipoamide acetyltransferase family protein [Angustibacter sp.]